MQDMQNTPTSVALSPCASYARQELEQTVHNVLLASNIISKEGPAMLTRGSKVLVKPNLLRNNKLTCTEPEVVHALCFILQEYGIKPIVADSPSFGTVQSVARGIGLCEALKPLGITVQGFDKSTYINIDNGKKWSVAKLALESDAIISVPRLKAHCQMRLTLGVKNLFGCIVGLHKPVAHMVQGRSLESFSQSILNLYKALPPTASLMDGICAMHVTGPSGGKPLDLKLIGASTSAMALDTAIYIMLKVEAAKVPLWQCARQGGWRDALEDNIVYPLAKPEDFNANDFILPQNLQDISFLPHHFVISIFKRILSRFK